MRNGNLLIDMHVHLARYEVLSDSTREWFISLYPSEAAYQAVCDANASPEDFCAMLAEKGVDYAVVLIIVCAAALAFVVLYNLTNINITERIREIATIKVLGFYPGETSAYVFRENNALTFLGMLVGLPLGKWLHAYVMSQIRIDTIAFDVRIAWQSVVFSMLLTAVFAAIVNVVMYFKLRRISMAESLKSIE